MSHTPHTKGPWTLSEHKSFVQKHRGDRQIETIAEVYADANASLIAAAPDMLEALEEFIQCGPNAGHNLDLRKQVLEAIAKARGGVAP